MRKNHRTVFALVFGGRMRACARHDTMTLLTRGGRRPFLRLLRRRAPARAFALSAAQVRGTASVLVTCDEDNAGSRAVIERAGGHFDKRVDGDGSGPKRHYWFETSNLGATASS